MVERKKTSIREILETTVHKEKIRIRTNPWKVDPPDDKVYWQKIQKQLISTTGEGHFEADKELLREIIFKYVNEITGFFKISSYKFARSVLTFGFARLLNAVRVKGFFSTI